jgi:hypothetical protein
MFLGVHFVNNGENKVREDNNKKMWGKLKLVGGKKTRNNGRRPRKGEWVGRWLAE